MSTLADAFRELGCNCVIFTGQDEPINYVNFDVVILDTYEIDDSYISNLRSPNNHVLVCYDDNGLYNYDCDVLINANFHAKNINFRFSGTSPKLFLGAKYALLRHEFQELDSAVIKNKATRIFVCFGGADTRLFTPFVLKSLLTLARNGTIQITVVLGAYTTCDNEVNALASLSENNAVVFKNPPNMATIMRSCDIAITAAGSMVYELASIGIPTLLITQAENQRLIAKYVHENGLMKWLGDWDSVTSKQLIEEVISLLNDITRRQQESDKLTKTVNKNGANQLASAILEVANETLRKD